jgi:oxaloacetate decarboxylase alpha subunit/pyruvate carboxylase subunit B
MQKYGKERVPDSVKPITLADVQKQKEMIEKAKRGELIEKTCLDCAPLKSENARTFNVFIEDEYFEVGVDEVGGGPVITYAVPAASPPPAAPAVAAPVPEAPKVVPKGAPAPKPAPKPDVAPAPAESAGTRVLAPMPGMVIKYEKKVGDTVKEGETIVVIEAMKMENALPAPAGGVVKKINFSSGDSVAKGDVLAVIE